jgi:hypothetical protein
MMREGKAKGSPPTLALLGFCTETLQNRGPSHRNNAPEGGRIADPVTAAALVCVLWATRAWLGSQVVVGWFVWMVCSLLGIALPCFSCAGISQLV